MGLKFRAVAADTGADRRQRVARVPGAGRFGRGRDRLLPGVRLRRQRRAGRGGRAARASRARRPSRCRRCRRPASRPARTSPRCCDLPLGAHGQVHHAARARARCTCCCVRGDHSAATRSRSASSPGSSGFRWASDAEIVAATGCRPGYLGPVGIPRDMPLIVDRTVAVMSDFVCGANEAGLSTCAASTSAATAASPTSSPTSATSSPAIRRPTARARSRSLRGIEVGHVFALGTVYSEAMGATLSRRRRSIAASWKWAATASASPASSPPRSSRTTTTRASSGREPLAPFTVAIAPIGYDRSDAVRGAGRPAARRARGGRRRRAARRPRRASWRDVCRSRADRHSAPHHHRRSRPEGRQGRVPGARATPRPTPVAVAGIAAFIRGKLARMTLSPHDCDAIAAPSRGRRAALSLPRCRRCAGAQVEEAAGAIGAALAASSVAIVRPAGARATTRPTAEGRGLARRHVAAARAKDARRADAARLPGHRPLRGHARRPRSAARARRDPAREQLPQVRGLDRRRARLHAGDAVLGRR